MSDKDAETLRILALPHCSQCGQAFEQPACGPTHALIAHERAQACPSLRQLTQLRETCDVLTDQAVTTAERLMVAEQEVAQLREKRESPAASKVVWLVERVMEGNPVWLKDRRGIGGGVSWTLDASKASPVFDWEVAARREARWWQEKLDDKTIRATEHMFVSSCGGRAEHEAASARRDLGCTQERAMAVEEQLLRLPTPGNDEDSASARVDSILQQRDALIAFVRELVDSDGPLGLVVYTVSGNERCKGCGRVDAKEEKYPLNHGPSCPRVKALALLEDVKS